jgi:hypothetical protein
MIGVGRSAARTWRVGSFQLGGPIHSRLEVSDPAPRRSGTPVESVDIIPDERRDGAPASRHAVVTVWSRIVCNGAV